MAELSAGNAKLVQYLNEAYGTEKRLETALEAHIAITVRPAYKKRLKQHLSETKRHARVVQQRIKRLGGTVAAVSVPGPQPITTAAQVVVEGAHKAVALAQGPLHALRGTGEDEKQLKNAKTEYASEAEEIATYTAIETLAHALGDKDTLQAVKAIRREEERMLAFLGKEIPRLAKAVAKAEIPPSQRSSGKTKAARAANAKATGKTKATRAASTKATPKAKATSAGKNAPATRKAVTRRVAAKRSAVSA